MCACFSACSPFPPHFRSVLFCSVLFLPVLAVPSHPPLSPHLFPSRSPLQKQALLGLCRSCAQGLTLGRGLGPLTAGCACLSPFGHCVFVPRCENTCEVLTYHCASVFFTMLMYLFNNTCWDVCTGINLHVSGGNFCFCLCFTKKKWNFIYSLSFQ